LKNERSFLFSDKATWIKIIIGGVAVSVWTGTFTVALNYTSLTRVYLLNNSQPLLIVVWNKITGKPSNVLHYFGVGVGFVGLALTCFSGNGNGFEFTTAEIVGDVIAFLGAVAAAIYISIGGEVRSKVPSFLYLAPTTIVSLLLYAGFTLILESTPPSLLFSWYHTPYLAQISWLAVITGLLGVSVIAIVMKYLPPLLISIVLLAEPVVASILAILLKVEENPGWLTWLGASLVTVGVMLVSLGFGGTAILNCWQNRRKVITSQGSVAFTKLRDTDAAEQQNRFQIH
jgi:drug/metabolite transporter (DMT)-like permease